MSTRALIIGKSKDGQYHYGQTHFDGMDNLEWLQKNINDADKVEEFLRYMTEGCADGGEGHGISSLGYEKRMQRMVYLVVSNMIIINLRLNGMMRDTTVVLLRLRRKFLN